MAGGRVGTRSYTRENMNHVEVAGPTLATGPTFALSRPAMP